MRIAVFSTKKYDREFFESANECNEHSLTFFEARLTETRHLINSESIERMKRGVVLVSTSRGGIVDSDATIAGLKTGQIGGLAIDVYEEEADLFFEDLSRQVIHDDVFARLLTFPNVLITGHQAFFTQEAMQQIAATTLSNIIDVESSTDCHNTVPMNLVRSKP